MRDGGRTNKPTIVVGVVLAAAVAPHFAIVRRSTGDLMPKFKDLRGLAIAHAVAALETGTQMVWVDLANTDQGVLT